MKNLFETYSSLWPAASYAQLKPLLEQVVVVHYPKDMGSLRSLKHPNKAVVVSDGIKIQDVVELSYQGFEHFVQMKRSDFSQELLASGLMAVRPKVFAENPIPFFFAGFMQPQSSKMTNANMVLEFSSSKAKTLILDRLYTFLGQESALSRIRDLGIQVADEMVSNALYSAPTTFDGQRLFKGKDRTEHVVLPAKKGGTLFATFTDEKLVIGCQDLFGSLGRNELLADLRTVFRADKVEPKQFTAGAGLGLKYIIDNAASFYVYVEANKRTIVACAFQVGSLKKNLDVERHIHLSFS